MRIIKGGMFHIIEQLKSWCRQKIKLHTTTHSPPFFKQGELWWCSIGMNVGDEIYGKGNNFRRPMLILKKITKNVFLALPATSQEKYGTWYAEIKIHGIRSWIILCQARTLDARRLWKRIGQLPEFEITRVRNLFIEFLKDC